MAFRKINTEKERQEILDVGQELEDYGEPARRLYQENPEEFNRIFKEQKKQRKKWKGFHDPRKFPYVEEKETA